MNQDIRKEVKGFYGEIAGKASCCSGGSCCSISNTSAIYDLEKLQGLPLEAINASLGCANPLALADLKEGETVLDLGSGGGIDVLAASRYVGASGHVYGLDMTDEMLNLARQNMERMKVDNVDFLQGYIEDIPLEDNSVDVVMSNCVINLSGDKARVMQEIYRVLKPQGRVAIADIVSLREVPDRLRGLAQLWVNCIGGALAVDEYQHLLARVGFKNIDVEPVHFYTREVLEAMNQEINNLTEEEWAVVDGAFAGAYVKAVK